MRNSEPERETLPSAPRIAVASTAEMESDTFDGTLPATIETEPEDAAGGGGSGGWELSAGHPMDKAAATITGPRLCLNMF
jgi:hypothetical protein